ncbi:ISL3 family transposase, partial [Streptococcus saliviloxodontae]
MELQNYIKESLSIKDPNIVFDEKMETFTTHREYHAKLDYNPPKCPACQGQMAKYDFQKPCKIPYLETVGFK